VDRPRIHEGSGEIRKISDAKEVDSKHDTRELDTLLREIYDKFVTVDSGDGMYFFPNFSSFYSIRARRLNTKLP